ncbi:hypothetical protein PMAYCL1PPCAC_21461, partial [Pristionchus mayeri]
VLYSGEIDANASCIGYPRFAPTPACPYPGWCLEILSVILRSGNIPYEFIVDKNLTWIDWGRLEVAIKKYSEAYSYCLHSQDDGKFSGILGRIESGEVDTACLFYQKSVLRLEHFDFSVSVT